MHQLRRLAAASKVENTMKEFAFDIRLRAALRVQAATQAEAERMLSERLDCADATLGRWHDGSPIIAEVSLDEVDGVFDVRDLNT
jgi:hypothetical protein